MESLELGTSQFLGTVFYTIVVFVLGSLIGPKMWGWVSKFFPWNRD